MRTEQKTEAIRKTSNNQWPLHSKRKFKRPSGGYAQPTGPAKR